MALARGTSWEQQGLGFQWRLCLSAERENLAHAVVPKREGGTGSEDCHCRLIHVQDASSSSCSPAAPRRSRADHDDPCHAVAGGNRSVNARSNDIYRPGTAKTILWSRAAIGRRTLAHYLPGQSQHPDWSGPAHRELPTDCPAAVYTVERRGIVLALATAVRLVRCQLRYGILIFPEFYRAADVGRTVSGESLALDDPAEPGPVHLFPAPRILILGGCRV